MVCTPPRTLSYVIRNKEAKSKTTKGEGGEKRASHVNANSFAFATSNSSKLLPICTIITAINGKKSMDWIAEINNRASFSLFEDGILA